MDMAMERPDRRHVHGHWSRHRISNIDCISSRRTMKTETFTTQNGPGFFSGLPSEIESRIKPPSTAAPLFASAPVAEEKFFAVRRRAVLEGCKWDPQVGDVSTLAEFSLLMKAAAWNELAELAERLAAETLAAER